MNQSNPQERTRKNIQNLSIHPTDNPSDIKKLIKKELHDHQIELEMQNEELIKRELELQIANQKINNLCQYMINLYDFSPISYCTLDKHGTITNINLTGANKFGQNRDRVLHTPFYHYVVKEDRDTFFLHLRETFEFEDQQMKTCELRLIGKNDEPFHAELKCILNGENANESDRCRMTFADITDRKRTEEALKESEARYRMIFETSLEGIWIIDAEANTIKVNQRMADMLGYIIEEMQGRSLFEFMDEYWKSEAHQKFEMRKHGISERHEFCFRQKDGSKLWTIISSVPVMSPDGKFLYVFGMITDITERKQIEELAKQNGEQYRMFVEGMNEGFIVLDKTMTLVFANNKFCEISGYAKDEIIGKPWTNFFDENNQRIVKEHFSRRQQGDSTTYTIDITCKDNRQTLVKISPKPIFDSDSTFQGVFSVITDIGSERVLNAEHKKTSPEINRLYQEIEEYNHAIKVLLKKYHEDQKVVEENIFANIREIITPCLEKLKHTRLNEYQMGAINIKSIL